MSAAPAWRSLYAIAADASDPGKELNNTIAEHTGGQLQTIFEVRSRFEYRPGQSFQLNPISLPVSIASISTNIISRRSGFALPVWRWTLVLRYMARRRRPELRDPLDLHEAFTEIRPETKTGFGAIAGRGQANYGDTRLIGSPQWAYIPRIYDGARAFWRGSRYRLEALLLAPVKLNSSSWNKPVMGDRVEGACNVVSIHKHLSSDWYYLRHYQNRANYHRRWTPCHQLIRLSLCTDRSRAGFATTWKASRKLARSVR